MDNHDAALVFGSANLEKVRRFKLLGGSADFGDHAHLAGEPRGTAIICWSIDGRVAVKGILFSEGTGYIHTATLEIQFVRTDGATNTRRRRLSTNANPLIPYVEAMSVERVSPTGSFDKVRIKLFSAGGEPSGLTPVPPNTGNQEPIDPDGILVSSRTFNR